MGDGDVAALKEALCNQYLISKKLYVELEEERDASATAATEALSMILRLQREKAAEKMEACQYKRMVEERILHADQSLKEIEEVLLQKDMEIESLQFELRAYKLKLMNLGISMLPEFRETWHSETKPSSGNNVGSNKPWFNGAFRRSSSLPSLCGGDFCPSKGCKDDEILPICSMHSLISAASSDVSTVSTQRDKCMISDNETASNSASGFDDHEISSAPDRNVNGKTAYSSFFLDIFEVPEHHRGLKNGQPCKQLLRDTISETNSMIEMPNEAADYLFNDDEHLNKAFMNHPNGSKSSISGKGEIKIPTPKKKGSSFDYRQAVMDSSIEIDSSRSDIEQLKRRMQKLDDEWTSLQQDSSEKGNEHLKLLREIFKQLNRIETHIKSPALKKNSAKEEESSYLSVMEVCVALDYVS